MRHVLAASAADAGDQLSRWVVVVSVLNGRTGSRETVPFYADTAARASLLEAVLWSVHSSGSHMQFTHEGVADAQVIQVLKPFREG